MAIVYDWYENPNAEGESEERGLHPRPLLNGKVSMEQLYYRVHERSSLSVGDAKSAIDTLTQLCGEEILGMLLISCCTRITLMLLMRESLICVSY